MEEQAMSAVSNSQEESLTIEQTFEELEGILEMLEDDERPLEESFRYFQRGINLVKQCATQIDKVEKQIAVLNGEEDDGGF